MFTKINVTQRDINRGCRSDVDNCPVALASVRALKCGASVDNTYVELWKRPHKITRAHLPKIARTFIKKYDDGAAVKPFSFVLRHQQLPR